MGGSSLALTIRGVGSARRHGIQREREARGGLLGARVKNEVKKNRSVLILVPMLYPSKGIAAYKQIVSRSIVVIIPYLK